MSADDTVVERRVDLAAIAFVLLIPTLLFADVLFGGMRLYDRDITSYYYPVKAVVRQAMLSGQLPYWNPMFAGGQPLAANPEFELFYPPQWLILLPNYDLGFRLSIVVHFYIAALGMYLFLRSLRLRPLSAVFGSVTFTLSGLLSSLTNLLTFLGPMSWIPLILLFVLRFLRTERSRDLLLASLFLSMQVLCGEPMTLFQTILLIFGMGIGQARVGAGDVRAVLRKLFQCGLVVAIALLLGAAQLLPMIDHARDSVRSLGFSYRVATGWSTPPMRLIELVFPHWMGSLTEGGANYWGASYYQPATGPFISSFYLGLLSLVLIVTGFIRRTRGWSLVATVAAYSTLLAAGQNTPFYRLLFPLPFFSATRYPEKYLLGALFVLIAFAAVVLNDFLEGDAAVARTLRLVIVTVAAVSALALGLSFLPQYESWFKLLWHIPSEARITHFLALARFDWAMAMLRITALAGVVVLLNRRRGALAAAALLTFLVVDLAPVALEAAPRISRTFFSAPPAASMLPGDRDSYRLFNQAALDFSSPDAQRYLNGAAGYWTLRNGLFPMTPNRWGFSTVLERDFDKTGLLPTARMQDALSSVLERGDARALGALLMMSNVRYRFVYADYDLAMREAAGRIERALPIRAVAVPLVPRYYFAEQVVTAPNSAAVVKQLTERGWPQRVAFVETSNADRGSGVVTRLSETANHVDLDVSCSGNAMLVVGITRHKYWRASIDGRPVPLIAANIAYQALRVPDGSHHVVLRYRNPLVIAGMAISALTLLAAVIVAARAGTAG